jgi:hypothetical protein
MPRTHLPSLRSPSSVFSSGYYLSIFLEQRRKRRRKNGELGEPGFWKGREAG